MCNSSYGAAPAALRTCDAHWVTCAIVRQTEACKTRYRTGRKMGTSISARVALRDSRQLLLSPCPPYTCLHVLTRPHACTPKSGPQHPRPATVSHGLHAMQLNTQRPAPASAPHRILPHRPPKRPPAGQPECPRPAPRLRPASPRRRPLGLLLLLFPRLLLHV